MNYKQIESLKFALLNLARQGCRVSIPSYGINGRIIAMGFKPYWTSPVDSKIEKLEINYVDDYGRIVPFNFHNIISYNVISNDGTGFENMRNACVEFHVFSQSKSRDEEPIEKVLIEISKET
ncbi:MAG TPA: hypothetical protein VHP38_07125 [Ruminiclostridium sp.]|nr:hypothetical protein [Ruminiclostridium sp.]